MPSIKSRKEFMVLTKTQFRLSFSVYVTFSPSRSVRCVTNKPPAMRVRDEGYTKKLQTRYNKGVQAIVKREEKSMAQKAHSLSHTKWMCKYHIVFTPKYHRKSIYYKIRQDLYLTKIINSDIIVS